MLVHLCLIMDLALFSNGDPTAVAVLGDVRRLQAQIGVQDSDRALDLVLAGASEHLPDARQILEATGDPGDPVIAARDVPAAALCPHDAGHIVDLTPVDQAREGAVLWQPGNVMTGIASLEQVPQRLREALRIPQPRPMDPARLPGRLYQLPEGEARNLLWRLAYGNLSTDWLWLHDQTLAFVAEGAAGWLNTEGLTPLKAPIARRNLFIGPASHEALVPGDPGLFSSEAPPTDGMNWMQVRRVALP